MPANRLAHVIHEAGERQALDAPARLLERIGGGLPRRIAERAGDWLGHPAHPPVTDLPIGFWTSAWVLDLLPNRASTNLAARKLIGFGVVSAGAAAFTGAGDAASMDQRQRRLAALHGALNVGATLAYTCSWCLRRRELDSRSARSIAHLGAALATAAGAIGGHLAFQPAASTSADSSSEGDLTGSPDAV